ncbi:hypothetical protein Pst134EA_025473 [Puccinia striiformis f. sp. tritici]|uniref:hypothetical protein n=1 Tax=Puccinia striiformis f. sp. tritici TaxID=168172 RepID=UPI0020077785|nr:hypothetical protein Pst134EA_025473 [Puccinia striiformis f. sp. tritici]KAH9451523.1 hypothetical protein Pst134EA_025473 [Puccinia striiformis f. sp. tritici]
MAPSYELYLLHYLLHSFQTFPCTSLPMKKDRSRLMRITRYIFTFVIIAGLVTLDINGWMRPGILEAPKAITSAAAEPVDDLRVAADLTSLRASATPEPSKTPVWKQRSTPSWMTTRPTPPARTPNRPIPNVDGAGPSGYARHAPASAPGTPARDAGPSARKYWLSYDVGKNKFIEELDRPKGKSTFSRLLPSKFSKLLPSKFSKLLPDSHESEALKLFKNLYGKKLAEKEKLSLVTEALDYLFKQNELSAKELTAWVEKLIKIGTEDEKISTFHAPLFYGLHTMALKYSQKPELYPLIADPLKKVMKSLPDSFRKTASSEMEKALFNPGVGDAKTFAKEWSQIIEDIRIHRSIKEFQSVLADSANADKLNRHYTNMFSRETMGSYSSQTRVTSLAILDRLMETRIGMTGTNKPVKILLTSMKDNHNDKFFLFQHERVMLSNIIASRVHGMPFTPNWVDVKIPVTKPLGMSPD